MKFLAIGLALTAILIGYVCFLIGVGFGRTHPTQRARDCHILIAVKHGGNLPVSVDCRELRDLERRIK